MGRMYITQAGVCVLVLGIPHGAIPSTADVLVYARSAVQLGDCIPMVSSRVILGFEVLARILQVTKSKTMAHVQFCYVNQHAWQTSSKHGGQTCGKNRHS